MAKAPTTRTIFERVRSEIAGLFGFADVNNLTFAERLRLDHAVAMKIELDRLQGNQLRGEPVDIGRLTAASEELARLLSQEPEQQYDLTRLTDDELRIVTHLLGKAAGEPAEDVIDSCVVEPPKLIVGPVASIAPASTHECDQLRWQAERDAATIGALEARVSELQALLEAASIPETEAEERLLKLLRDNGVAA
jgi:hypothetical protein